MPRPLLKRFLLVVAVLALGLWHLWPPQKTITLGLDLKGGTSYTLELDLTRLESWRHKQALEKAIEILRKRVDRFGLSEPIIQPSGDNRIIVQIPGLSEADKASARSQLERVAYLELRLVHPQNAAELARMESVHAGPPPGYELCTLTAKRAGRAEVEEKVLVKIKPELTGKHLSRAAAMNGPGGYEVAFELNDAGAEIFRRVTKANIGNRLAIILDKKLISAPVIQSEIGARGQITGDFDYREATDLANSLENPLETPLKVVEERGVDPSLGADSVRSGIRAGIVGLAAVVVFMGIYYLRAGLIANLALCVNIVLLLSTLAIFKFTLTLPGVAGIILTVGIAVDANVLIFERIREELRKGKAFAAAVDAGFNRAFGTIIDANMTTLITALVLAWLGTGPIQGFGYTLSAGVCTSVFAALVVSRLIMDAWLRWGQPQKLRMLSMVLDTKINFLGFKWPAYLLSGAIILGGAFSAWKKGNDIYGVDFTGGDSLTLRFTEKQDPGALRRTLEGHGFHETFIQYQREAKGGGEVLVVRVPFDQGDRAQKALAEAFPQAGFNLAKLDKVGGTVGHELQWKAIQGLAVASVCILIYITARFEFAYAVGAVFSLLHDAAICLAFLFFTDRQLSLPVIGALLTIAGYSLNDTVVVFDRIREEFRLRGAAMRFVDLINLSVNATLSRTLLTSLTTLIAAGSLYLFGGGVINDFAFILVIGVLTGTYSSVFIASPILLLWHPSKLAPQTELKPSAKPGYEREAPSR
ncbi:MAG: protein translocase subunit SecD [Verrucomicrobiae bacterium]|nr:protein translocase subunit SecD [Verrucomicrobiae bacterium]